MAYLDLHHAFDTATATPAPAPAPAPVAHFDDTEWRIIVLAKTETLSSLSEPGPIARLLRRLIGTPTVRGLASPRLEALRRFSVLAWHYSYALPVSAVSAMLNAGFDEAQLEYALASIARFRSQTASRHA